MLIDLSHAVEHGLATHKRIEPGSIEPKERF